MGWLHAVIQLAMGWTNSHLHQFRCGDRVVTDPKFDLEEYADFSPETDERKIHFNEVVAVSGEEFIYDCDFGDSWTYQIIVKDLKRSSNAIAKKAV